MMGGRADLAAHRLRAMICRALSGLMDGHQRWCGADAQTKARLGVFHHPEPAGVARLTTRCRAQFSTPRALFTQVQLTASHDLAGCLSYPS